METVVNAERVDIVVLAWLWCQKAKPKKIAELAGAKTGVAPLLPDGLAEGIVTESLDRLVSAAQVDRIEPGTRKSASAFRINSNGEERLQRALHRAQMPAKATFASMRDGDLCLLAAGLPLPLPGKLSPAAIGKLLHLAVCARQFQLVLPFHAGVDPARLTLVQTALAKSHGVPVSKICLKKVPGGELPALVVAPLLDAAGAAATNLDKLVEAKALNVLGISDPRKFKLAIVRQWLGGPAGTVSVTVAGTSAATSAIAPQVDLPAFARRVMDAARQVSLEGGPGLSNLRDKVLIHSCWRRFEQMFGPIPLDEFKARVLKANGPCLTLACEDLIPDARRSEFLESEVRAGTSSYHYIRLIQG